LVKCPQRALPSALRAATSPFALRENREDEVLPSNAGSEHVTRIAMLRLATLLQWLTPSVALGIAAMATAGTSARPITSHYSENRCGGSSTTWLKTTLGSPEDGLVEWGVMNVIQLDGKTVHWNDMVIRESRALRLIAAVGKIAPAPLTELRIRGNADCALVQRIRTTLQQTVDCSEKCIEYSEAEWTARYRAPPPPPPRRHTRK